MATANLRSELEKKLTSIFSARPLAFADRELILDSYSEPWRHYHNCRHIVRMLDLLQQIKPKVSGKYIHALEVMIVYHDVVYKLGREKGWNENESAVVAGKHLTSAGYDTAFVDLVTEGIICTIDHVVPDSLANWAEYIWPLIDIDLLAGFGTNWEEFSQNTKLIGEEYSPLYTQAEYLSGRAKFSKSFLERAQIFHNPLLSEYDFLVRENLRRMAAMSS